MAGFVFILEYSKYPILDYLLEYLTKFRLFLKYRSNYGKIESRAMLGLTHKLRF